jgi:GNAT superfamily N-acetyltransferase
MDVVRPVESAAELEQSLDLAGRVFFSEVPSDDFRARAHRWLDDLPGRRPDHARGIFRDGRCLARYHIYDRFLQIGPARLPTVCIGGVATDSECRHQGLGSALMRDAVDWAQREGRPLLLLSGIAEFYQPFGYVDCLDVCVQHVNRVRAAELPASDHTVRPARPDDDEELLRLYHLAFDAHPGSFDRSLVEQRHRLNFLAPDHLPQVALDPAGAPRGYLAPGFATWGAQAVPEVAAESEAALVALLHHHAKRVAQAAEPPEELAWRLPPDSREAWLLEELLPVRTARWSHPRAGWQARPGHLPSLLAGLAPVLAQRWRGRAPARLTLAVDDCAAAWELREGRAEPVDSAQSTAQFTPGAFIQALFGFRSVDWLAGRGLTADDATLDVLRVLFPLASPWIAGSDDF